MPVSLSNPLRFEGLAGLSPRPLVTTDGVAQLLSLCPAHQPTPLLDLPDLARRTGVARMYVKDESRRMGLGSFKALGAAYAIASAAEEVVQEKDWANALTGRIFVTASAGNHGLSVAAGARLFGAKAVIYLSEAVPEAFAIRLRAMGAEVVRAGATYEESMEAAEASARSNDWTLLSDSSWPGYTEWPLRVMEGYLQLSAETVAQIDAAPTHIVLQAGVGGMAAAVADHARVTWGDAPIIIVVEPEVAPALMESIRNRAVTTTEGPTSNMGRLDCKTPSMIALAGLACDADLFVTISEDEAASGVAELAGFGLHTTPSGGAGLAALLAGLALPADAHVLAILSEGREDG